MNDSDTKTACDREFDLSEVLKVGSLRMNICSTNGNVV